MVRKRASKKLTKTAEQCGHGLVFGHVNESSSKTEMGEYQQYLLHDIIDAGDILQSKGKTTVAAQGCHALALAVA